MHFFEKYKEEKEQKSKDLRLIFFSDLFQLLLF
jgi:hypothetical protein